MTSNLSSVTTSSDFLYLERLYSREPSYQVWCELNTATSDGQSEEAGGGYQWPGDKSPALFDKCRSLFFFFYVPTVHRIE